MEAIAADQPRASVTLVENEAPDPVAVLGAQREHPLGLDAGHGTIAAGQLADLIVVDGNPANDISCLRDRIVAIVRDGAFVRDAL